MIYFISGLITGVILTFVILFILTLGEMNEVYLTINVL